MLHPLVSVSAGLGEEEGEGMLVNKSIRKMEEGGGECPFVSRVINDSLAMRLLRPPEPDLCDAVVISS